MVTEKNPNELIATGATNYSPERVLIDQLIASYNAYLLLSPPKDRKGEIFACLARIINSEVGRQIVFFILTHEATTQYELNEHILADPATISRVLKKLRLVGLVDKRGAVKGGYKAGRGPKPQIWFLVGADPKSAIRAQGRYAELKQAENGYEQRRIKQAVEDDAQKRDAHADEVKRYSKLVITELGTLNLVQPKFSVIDEVLLSQNVPQVHKKAVLNVVYTYLGNQNKQSKV